MSKAEYSDKSMQKDDTASQQKLKNELWSLVGSRGASLFGVADLGQIGDQITHAYGECFRNYARAISVAVFFRKTS